MINALVFMVLGFLGMEVAGWFIHKYIMHGVLWRIHKTHHVHSKGAFELNDLFSLAFGSISVVLMVLGFESLDYRFWLGIGISAYGLCYFVVHDIWIHRRVKWLKRPEKGLFYGFMKAHQDHHKSMDKEGTEAFGLLLIPIKYFKEAGK